MELFCYRWLYEFKWFKSHLYSANAHAGIPPNGGIGSADLLAHLRLGLMRDELKTPGGQHLLYPDSPTPVTNSAGRTDAAPTTKEDKETMFKYETETFPFNFHFDLNRQRKPQNALAQQSQSPTCACVDAWI